MPNWMGIDPGLSGGIALIGTEAPPQASPMPETERDIWQLIDGLRAVRGIDFALIEELHAMPQAVAAKIQAKQFEEHFAGYPDAIDKQVVIETLARASSGGHYTRGPVATAKLMQNYGNLRMALIAADIPFDERVPRFWQRVVGCQGNDKNQTKAMAQQLFPMAHITLATADAFMIAECARIIRLHPEVISPRRPAKRKDKRWTEADLSSLPFNQ